MRFLDLFVKAKVYSQRSILYYQFIQLVMIFALFLRPYNFTNLEKVIIFIICAVFILILGHLDKRFILEREQSNYNSKNKELIEIKELLEEVKSKLK